MSPHFLSSAPTRDVHRISPQFQIVSFFQSLRLNFEDEVSFFSLTDQELRVLVIDPGVPAPDQGVGHGEAPQLVEVDHPDPVVRLSGDVQPPTTWTAV